jgi:hypothetical protein
MESNINITINDHTTQPTGYPSQASHDIDENQIPGVGSLDWLAQHDQNSFDNGTDSEGQSLEVPNPESHSCRASQLYSCYRGYQDLS